jgi:serine/threonine protein kinase
MRINVDLCSPSRSTPDGQYILAKCIGGGAEGQVYDAWEKTTGKACVVKIIQIGENGSPNSNIQMLRAHSDLMRLNDPNIVT